MSDHSDGNRIWENYVEEFRLSNSFGGVVGIDGEPTEPEDPETLQL